jgi:hypothetical protein
VVDTVETLGDIRVEHIFSFQTDAAKDCFDRIVCGASRAEPIAVRLEFSLPFRFQGEFDQTLSGAIAECRDA